MVNVLDEMKCRYQPVRRIKQLRQISMAGPLSTWTWCIIFISQCANTNINLNIFYNCNYVYVYYHELLLFHVVWGWV